MDRHLGSLFSWIIISNPQPNSPEVYDFKLLPCCYNKKVHFICLAYYHIKERRHCFLNSNTTRYVIKDRIRKKKKGTWVSEILPLTPSMLLRHLTHVRVCATLWMTVHQAPRLLGFSRQHWSGMPLPSPGDLPYPEVEPNSLVSLVMAGRFFSISTTIPSAHSTDLLSGDS